MVIILDRLMNCEIFEIRESVKWIYLIIIFYNGVLKVNIY